VKGHLSVFHIDSVSQVTRLGDLDQEVFFNLFLEYRDAYKAVQLEFREGRHSEAYAEGGRLNLRTFIHELYKLFTLDLDMALVGEPLQLSWDTNTPAFKVLSPSILVEGPTNAWQSFTERLDHPQTFKAFVWSLFVPTNFGRQCLWIQGEGWDGKSSVLNALTQFYGLQHTMSISKGSLDSAFFFAGAFGKRLGIYNDCKNLKLLRSEHIKNLLGRDIVDINQKNEKSFAGRVYTKLFIGSNGFPQINYNDNSERSRLLLIRVSGFKNKSGDPAWEHDLLAQLPAFLLECRAAYETECPRGDVLNVPPSMAETIETLCTATDSEILERFMDSLLEYGPSYHAPRSELHLALKTYFREHWENGSSFTENDFDRLLMKKGIQLGMVNGIKRCFMGVRLKMVRV
jgi:hypothetical protein